MTNTTTLTNSDYHKQTRKKGEEKKTDSGKSKTRGARTERETVVTARARSSAVTYEKGKKRRVPMASCFSFGQAITLQRHEAVAHGLSVLVLSQRKAVKEENRMRM